MKIAFKIRFMSVEEYIFLILF